jgi:peptidoglycan/xylan/chitin deacetylase (PgdA/CDA1 family)
VELLEILERYRVKATFFQCGMHVRRLPQIAAEVARAGHEVGNHGDTHTALYLKSPGFVYREIARAQESVEVACSVRPRLFRAPYGARWFGLRAAQRRFGLLGVMWTAIGQDWKSTPEQIMRILRAGARNGAIFCLHDGRERQIAPDIRSTLEATRRIVPELLEKGYRFETVTDLLCPRN